MNSSPKACSWNLGQPCLQSAVDRRKQLLFAPQSCLATPAALHVFREAAFGRLAQRGRIDQHLNVLLTSHRNFSASCLRAECKRDFTVPTGTCSNSATSSREWPSMLASRRTRRDFFGKDSIACSSCRPNSLDTAISSAVGLGVLTAQSVSLCSRRRTERA